MDVFGTNNPFPSSLGTPYPPNPNSQPLSPARAHVATRDPFLLSIHHVGVLLQHRRGADVGHVRAGARFADGQADVLASGWATAGATRDSPRDLP